MSSIASCIKSIGGKVKLALLCLIFSSSSAFASSCDRTLVVNASQNWLPYSYVMDEQYLGLEIEILELVFAKANLCLEFVTLPSTARALVEMEKGNVDLVFAASKSEDRQRYASFTMPYRKESMALFTHVDNNGSHKLTDSVTVAVNRGGFYGDQFNQYRAQCPKCVVDVSLASQRLFLLQNKRVDYVIEDTLAGQHVIASSAYADAIKSTKQVVHDNEVHYMIGKKALTQAQLAQIDQIILQQADTISSIIDRYQQKYQD